MTTVIALPFWHVLALCVAIVSLVIWPGRRSVQWLVVGVLVVMQLTGCATNAAPPSLPDPLPAPVVCAPGVGMTEYEPPPASPAGQYTQRDVASYVTDLHQWGSRGWEKVARVRQWSLDCVERTTVRDGGGAD